MNPIIHDEHVTFECPCGGIAVGRFVLPNSRRQLTIVATCQTCYNKGDNKTSFAHLACKVESWETLMNADHIPALKVR